MISFIAEYVREYRFRRSIRSLLKHGMKIGTDVNVMPGVLFDEEYASLISIGDHCRIAEGVRILAHDASMYHDLGFARIGRVDIKEDSFIAVDSIILPGVSIGPHAIVAAGSVVSTDVPENSVVMGNPARVVGKKSDFMQIHNENFKNLKKYDYNEYVVSKKSMRLGEFKSAYLVGGEKKTNLHWVMGESHRNT